MNILWCKVNVNVSVSVTIRLYIIIYSPIWIFFLPPSYCRILSRFTFILSFRKKEYQIQELILLCPLGWGCRIHRLHLCWRVRPHPTESPGYDTNGEVPVMLELWGMWSTQPSLPLLLGPLWPGMVAPDKALSMG